MLKARQKLGKYRIRRRLAEGGFAAVYQAMDTVEGVPVALKVPYRHLLDRASLDLFRKEVRHAARLDSHPNILPVKNAQFIDDLFVIVHPLGMGSLADRLKRRLAVRKLFHYAEQMLEALSHAHQHRIIHCDIKPENFILFPGDRLRLADFGISRVAQRTLSASGSGTLGYLAPEQALGKPSLRSDVFSLGLILYQMLSGYLPTWPFDWPPPGMKRVKKKVHGDLIAWLERALHVDESRRYKSASYMLTAYRRLKSRGKLLAPEQRRKRRRAARKNAPDWKAVRKKLFLRRFRSVLELSATCRLCEGPVSEFMLVCPWCGRARKKLRDATRFPARCPRCRRGRKLDWKYCPWCHGPAFKRVSERQYSDVRYESRCSNRRCPRRDLMPFMRYCPWCHVKVRRGWSVPGSTARCSRCRWGVAGDFWEYCPWCAKFLGKKGNKK